MKHIKLFNALTMFIEKRRSIALLSLFFVILLSFAIMIPGSFSWAQDDDDDEGEIPFDVANVFFELNNTDGDLGIHALIDGEPWKRLKIEDKNGRVMLFVRNFGRLARQGLTELFFESAEPPFDELAPEKFFKRFPEGIYEVEGLTLEREELESEIEITHVMPAPAEGIEINGEMELPIMKERCDDEDPLFNPIEVSGPTVTISWDPVTMSHPDPTGGGAGVQPPVPVTIHNYEVVVETTLELAGGEEFDTVYSVVLPPDVTSITVPAEFITQAEEFKYEILAREESFNQTAIESCFVVE